MMRVGLSHDPLRFYLSFYDVSCHFCFSIREAGLLLLRALLPSGLSIPRSEISRSEYYKLLLCKEEKIFKRSEYYKLLLCKEEKIFKRSEYYKLLLCKEEKSGTYLVCMILGGVGNGRLEGKMAIVTESEFLDVCM